MQRPLAGIKVVDFTHVLAGPACSYFLGLLGAEVIKVESIGRGDAMRHRGGTDPDLANLGMSTAYQAQAAGKRSIALDLATEGGREVMTRLLSQADVFVENHLPETMQGFGLDEASTRRDHPRLIHCAMTGYGRGGPLENAPAYDVNIQAACGIMTLTGTPDTGPLRTGAPIMDYSVAMAAGFAVTSTLFQREQTGQGAFIDVSMLETGLSLMTSTITDYLATGHKPEPRGNAANSRSPGAGNFPCKEGVLSLGVNEESQFRRLALALNKADWLSDPRFATRQNRREHAAALETDLAETLKSRTAQEWETLLLDQKVPAARLRSLPECLETEQVKARTFLHQTKAGVTVPTLPFRIDHSTTHAPQGSISELGADTHFILASGGFNEQEITQLKEVGAVG